MAKYGLGKGLEALIPESAPESPKSDAGRTDGGVASVPLSRVSPSADQPRKRFDDQSIAELADSIRRHGVIQPLILEADGSGGYRIVAGERRWRAATLAGLAEVPAIVKEYGLEKRLEIALVENVQREDLNPIDEAEAYRQLMEATGLTQDQVAERVGKSRPAVANALRLLGLPADAMEALRSGAISAGHARAILSAVDPAHRRTILRRAVDDGISVREAEALAAACNSGGKPADKKPAKQAEPRPLDPNLAAIEQDLIGRLGTKVAIRGDASRGSITIDYFSMDDLDRVFGIIAGGGS
ncbi:MAG TPA: ParB/RepB/Spo0J family partition protein [Spirochaetales bacterium]|nr:ParB/RepB/Spo0J family partition protein [Spirochaetales bacterium]HPG87579.1 ParB/RepB/Spo0J family partition protein [Spirochaetales bacterium]HPM72815.1 ParB/RepB/Spo0J family partition protein [Spirochaetales bacterium]